MNPLIPPLHVSAAYVALSDREHGARLLAALRSPLPSLALVRLWDDLRTEVEALADAAHLTRIADVAFFLQGGLDIHPDDAAHVVGVVVKILTPPPALMPGALWTRPGIGRPWRQLPADEIPVAWPTVATPRLAAVCEVGGAFIVIGYDGGALPAYEEAATVSEIVGVFANCGLDTGLRAAASRARRGTPGGEQALAFAKRLAGAVEGL